MEPELAVSPGLAVERRARSSGVASEALGADMPPVAAALVDDFPTALPSEPEVVLSPPADAGMSVAELLSLYQGLPGALLKEGPPSALYLGVYEAAKAQLFTVPALSAQPL